MPVLPRSPVPLYFQLSSDLERRIDSNEFAPGTQLPNEKQLARDYGVSLITVRSAMRVLIDKRLVDRFSGKGTFVLERGAIRRIWSIGSLEDLVATGLRSRMKLVWNRRVYPPAEVAEKFNALNPPQKIYAMHTIRETDAEPFMSTLTYHPRHIGDQLKKADFTDEAARQKLVISIVEEKCRIKISRVRQIIGIERATQELARDLTVPAGEPLLAIDRDYFIETGEIVQVTRAWFRTDFYRYVINVSTMEDHQAANVERLAPRLVVNKK